jgi:hypothetical protein
VPHLGASLWRICHADLLQDLAHHLQITLAHTPPQDQVLQDSTRKRKIALVSPIMLILANLQ